MLSGLCSGTNCGCQRSQQVLYAERVERSSKGKEAVGDPYPKDPDYIVHATDGWYCSATNCGHGINLHTNKSYTETSLPTEMTEVHELRVSILEDKSLELFDARRGTSSLLRHSKFSGSAPVTARKRRYATCSCQVKT